MNSAIAHIQKFYADVQRTAERLEETFGSRLKCGKGCTSCCVDSITVFEIEAQNIREYNQTLLMEKSPHPKGKCAFLDIQGSCRIYHQRPYVCRTQGLPLRWLEDLPDGNAADMRDICPLNEQEIHVEELDPELCWEIGPWEERLAQMQKTLFDGNMERTALRDLFTQV